MHASTTCPAPPACPLNPAPCVVLMNEERLVMEHSGHARLDLGLDALGYATAEGDSAVHRPSVAPKGHGRTMRLLFAESSMRGYGTEQHIAALATAMARRGHDVRCVT